MTYRDKLVEFKQRWLAAGATAAGLRRARKNAQRNGIRWPLRMFPDVAEITEIEPSTAKEPLTGHKLVDQANLSAMQEKIAIASTTEDKQEEFENVNLNQAETTGLLSEQSSESIPSETENVSGCDQVNSEDNLALMTCSDSGNLWGNVNDWIDEDKFEGHYLYVRLVEDPGVEIQFVPFRQHGRALRGLRPNPASRNAWAGLASEARSDNPLYYAVYYHFEIIGY